MYRCTHPGAYELLCFSSRWSICKEQSYWASHTFTSVNFVWSLCKEWHPSYTTANAANLSWVLTLASCLCPQDSLKCFLRQEIISFLNILKNARNGFNTTYMFLFGSRALVNAVEGSKSYFEPRWTGSAGWTCLKAAVSYTPNFLQNTARQVHVWCNPFASRTFSAWQICLRRKQHVAVS